MLLLIFEESTQQIFKSFVERARAASTWEVRVVIGEGVSILSGVVFEAALWWVDAVDVVGSVDGIVCGFEGALAVPPVARVMLGPEGVVDGEREFFSQYFRCEDSGLGDVVGIHRRLGITSLLCRKDCQSAALCARMTAVSYSVRSHAPQWCVEMEETSLSHWRKGFR